MSSKNFTATCEVFVYIVVESWIYSEGIHKPCGRIFRHFWPSPLRTILLNRAYVVIWTFVKPPPSPLPCPHGLWMPPKVWTPCFDQCDLVESVNYRKRDWLELEIKPIIVKAFLWLMNLVAILFVLDICTITELGRIPIFILKYQVPCKQCLLAKV